MSLPRLTSLAIGVPNVEETIGYYTEFGLTHLGGGAFRTEDGGEQLRIGYAPSRRLVELGIGVDDSDDIARIASRLDKLGVARDFDANTLRATEPVSGFVARVEVAPRLAQDPVAATPYNGPGRTERYGRAPGVVRDTPIRPRKLGHTVVGTTDLAATMGFFTEGLGFKLSDHIGDKGAFMRCSVDHHNVLALAAPVNFLHHTTPAGRSTTSTTSAAAPRRCSRTTPNGTCGDSAGITPGPTSSGTSRTRPATSPSTTPTWTASPRTSSGSRRSSKVRRACTTGVRRRHLRSWRPTTSPP
jgi:hypothetical protein